MAVADVIDRPVTRKSLTKALREPPPSKNGKPETPPPESVVIAPPNFQRATIKIVGTAPFVQHNFSAKARRIMEERQRAGSQGKKNVKRESRNFEEDYEQAFRRSSVGWAGIPAPAFRNALISACRVAGFAMTRARLSVFVEADGIDMSDAMPLVRIYGEPQRHESYARNESGVADLRWRPMWLEWHCLLKLRWDADQFSASDLMNLLNRAGMQVGVGEGRPDSANSNGLGWGTFEISNE